MTRSRHLQTYDRRAVEAIGTQYGRLTVQAHAPRAHGGHVQVTCRCTCGTVVTVLRSNLRRGLTTSCGCYKVERTKVSNTTHGQAHTPLYMLWRGMIDRCENPHNPKFSWYGALGVQVCPAWRQDFAVFATDMGPRPSGAHSLDRWPDPAGGYEPGNVRWATLAEQRRNRRVNRFVDYQGRQQLLTDWARELGLPFSALRQRLRAGWTVEQTFTVPLRPDRRRDQRTGTPPVALEEPLG